MTRPTGIVSASHEVSLPKYSSRNSDTSPIRECGLRWEDRKNEFRDLPWAQCPPEMSADFVRSMARELLARDGDQAAMRAALFTASVMVEQGPPSIALGARHPKFGTHMEINGTIADYQESDSVVDIEVAIPKAAADQEALDVLDQVGEGPIHSGSPFDPIAQTPDTEIAKLLAAAEKAIGISSYETLVVAALPLLAWKKMEDTNAETLQFRLVGLQNGDEQILADDQCVVFQAKRFGLDASCDRKPEPTRTVHVRVPR